MKASVFFSALALSAAAASAQNTPSDLEERTLNLGSLGSGFGINIPGLGSVGGGGGVSSGGVGGGVSISFDKCGLLGSLFQWDWQHNTCRDCSGDVQNCGNCGNVCKPPANAQASCNNGQCSWTCNDGWYKNGNQCSQSPPTPKPQDCSSKGSFWLWDSVLNQCRDCSSDTQHCGSCGNSCQAPADATPKCNNGQCSWTCNTGYTQSGNSCVKPSQPNPQDCSTTHGSLWFWDKNSNQCRDCSSDNNNCGACGSKCTSAPQNGSPTCNQGHCDFTCNSGYTKSGTSCVPNSKPSPSPQPDCSSQGPFWLWDAVLGKCRDCSSDNQHCGSCGNSCQAPANAQASCSNGQCSWTCNQGYQKSGSSCIPAPNPNPQDCSTNHGSLWFWDKDWNKCRDCSGDTNNCGGCGVKCPSPLGGSATCNNGKCGIVCNDGWQPDGKGGCTHIDHQTDCNFCGQDGQDCTALFGQAGQCQWGICIPNCSIFGSLWDWDENDNKCRDCSNDHNNCGACGQQCKFEPAGATGTCSNGKCIYTNCPAPYVLQNNQCVCPSPYELCDGQCKLPPSQKAHSWKKSKMAVQKRTLCPAGETACPISTFGSLSPSLVQQFDSADAVAPAGGYECIDTATTLDSCGGCASTGEGVDCNLIPNAAGVGCEAGSCVVFSCEAGFRPSLDGTTCIRVGAHRNSTAKQSIKRHLMDKMKRSAPHQLS